jgi:hypothetical protein
MLHTGCCVQMSARCAVLCFFRYYCTPSTEKVFWLNNSMLMSMLHLCCMHAGPSPSWPIVQHMHLLVTAAAKGAALSAQCATATVHNMHAPTPSVLEILPLYYKVLVLVLCMFSCSLTNPQPHPVNTVNGLPTHLPISSRCSLILIMLLSIWPR